MPRTLAFRACTAQHRRGWSQDSDAGFCSSRLNHDSGARKLQERNRGHEPFHWKYQRHFESRKGCPAV